MYHIAINFTSFKERVILPVMNIERSVQSCSEQELVDRSFVITSVDGALQHGLTQDDIQMLSEEVSHSIGEYNYDHNSEMLPKTPETIYNQLALGLSCMIIAEDDARWRFLHHGSVYPVFEKGEERILNTQIVEFGSEITHRDFRKGFGLGTRGESVCVEIMNGLASPGIEVFGILTVKRLVTGHVWRKLGVNPISFWQHPYTSFLTNTCEGSSERYGHESCQFRRSIEESRGQVLTNLFEETGNNPYLPCTLLATDRETVQRFEERCRNLHSEFGGQPLTQNDISINSYTRAQEFFDRVASL